MDKVKVEDLMKACEYLDSIPTLYGWGFPANCLSGLDSKGYYYKTADCNNLIKCLLWTNCQGAYNKNYGQENYQPNDDLWDMTGGQMLARCYDRSTDMENIEVGEFLYLVGDDGWHCGLYCGDRKVFEATPIWEDGLMYSDIANDGTRSRYGVKSSRWMEHGKMPWVEYPQKEVEMPITAPTEDISLIEAQGDADENLVWWKRLHIDIMYAVAKAINETFKKE